MTVVCVSSCRLDPDTIPFSIRLSISHVARGVALMRNYIASEILRGVDSCSHAATHNERTWTWGERVYRATARTLLETCDAGDGTYREVRGSGWGGQADEETKRVLNTCRNQPTHA
jgi:hypothetical protein